MENNEINTCVSTGAFCCDILKQEIFTTGGVFVGEQSEKIKKNICMGLLAHVDAGKTTLSEALLYLSGKIRKLGRVDHKDAYLDTSPL